MMMGPPVNVDEEQRPRPPTCRTGGVVGANATSPELKAEEWTKVS